jgi:diguanylate cyclase (GGDEF)-like protein
MEAVNSDTPLSGILEDIAEAVSSQLSGIACWFDLDDGSHFGRRPAEPAVSAPVARAILSRSGKSLGSLNADLPTTTPLTVDIDAALNLGVHLAALAIENRRLHADLVRRSEFDLLTDVPNRFYMERHLDELLRDAVRRGSIFALIYIDLDRFKQVNDSFGHRVGDMFLQHVALRVKNQLRTGNSLARVGGDEFAALVSSITDPAEAQEIAVRLEHCFASPFRIEGHEILGSASLGVAVYPRDGLTAEALQQFADNAMYAVKRRHREALPYRARTFGT